MPNPADWVALGAFEFAGLVVSRLSSDVLDQARIVSEERGHLEKLLRFARSILLLNLHEPAGPQIADFIDQAIEADAVALFDSAAARVYTAGSGSPAIETAARDAWVRGGNADDPAAHIWSRVLRLGHNSIGAVALGGKDLNPLVMDAIASITAVALERAHSFEKETRAEGARQSDQLRTAVLDALAHAFKTPLTAILAATSGLLDAGSLSPRETDLVTLIDEESIRLNDLATRLLQTARLDSNAIKVQKNGCTLPHLLERVTDAFYAELESGRISVDLPPNAPLLSGDCALIATALRQFVDNAVKYSNPSSAITISVQWTDKEIVMSVHNYGPVILPEDRERIFDRFYRSPGTEHRAAGTGLGLSISRKVAEAHHGRAWVVSDEAAGTTFFLSLPRAPFVK
jgi:two-component system sensor histidine kinase KdpD